MDASTLIQYFNYGIIVCLVLGALSGLRRGLYKSSYKLITSTIILIAGFIFLDPIINFILDFDISKYASLSIPINGTDISLVTVRGFVEDLVVSYLNITDPNIVVTELELFSVIIGVISLVLKIVIILVLLILNVTVFKFIFWIVWLFIKPKKVNGRKPKKTFVSRLLGAGVSTVHTAFSLLLLMVPICGLCSIGGALGDVATNIPVTQEISDDHSVTLVLGKDMKLLEGNQMSNPYGNGMEQIQPYLDFMKNYENTLAGQIYGVFEIEEGKSIDYYLFDELFKIAYEKEVPSDEGSTKVSVEVRLREELVTVTEIYSVLSQEIDLTSGTITTDDLIKLPPQTIEEVFNKASNLHIIDVVVPVGVEYLSLTGTLDQISGESGIMTKEELSEVLVKISSYKMSNEITKIGSALSNVVSALQEADMDAVTDESGNVDMIALIMSLDSTKVQSALDSLAEIKLVDDAGSIALAALEQSGQLDQILTLKPTVTVEEGNFYLNGVNTNISANTTAEEAVLTSVDGYWSINGFNTSVPVEVLDLDLKNVSLCENIKALGGIFEACQDLGITSFTDLQAIMSSEKFTDENIESLSQALFGLSIISNNSKNIAKIVNNVLPGEYRSFIKFDDMTANELTSLLSLAKIMSDAGLLSGEENIDIVSIVKEHGEEIIDALYKSQQISKNIGGVVELLLKQAGFDQYITIPESFDFASGSGKNELKNLIKAVAIILDSGLINNESGIDLDSLTDEKIEEIAECLGSSVIIKSSMNKLIDLIVNSGGSQSLPIASIEEEEWTKEEFVSIFKSIKIILSSEDILSTVLNFSEEEVDVVLGSKLISKTLVNFLVEYTQPAEGDKEAGPLYGILDVQLDKESSEWYDVYNDLNERISDGELRKVFTSIHLLLGENFDINNVDVSTLINNVFNLSDGSNSTPDQIGQLLSSRIISDTIVLQISNLKYDVENNPSGVLVYDDTEDGFNWYGNDGELRKLFKAISEIFGEENIDLDNIDLLSVLNKIKDDTFINTVLDSKVLSHTIVKYINDMKYDEINNPSGVLVFDDTEAGFNWYGNDGELRKLFKAVKAIFGEDDIDFNNIQVTSILNKVKDDEFVNTLVDSKVLSSTIVKYVNDMKYDEGTNPTGILVYDDTEDGFKWYGSDGELRKLFKGISVLFKGDVDLGSINANMILGLTDEEVDTLIDSKVLEGTLRDKLVQLSGDIIVVDKNKINDKAQLSAEMKALLKAIDIVLVKDGEGNIDLSNPSVNMNGLLNLSDDDRHKLLSSYIICDTVIKQLKGNGMLKVERDEYNWYGIGGELDNLFKAVGLILTDLDSFNVDSLLNIKNSIGTETDEVSILLSSYVLRDTIVDKIINLSEPIVVEEKDIYATSWDDQGINPGEIRKLLTSIKALLGEGSTLSSPDISIDAILSKTDDEINNILDSVIVSDSIAVQIYNLVVGGTLNDFLEVSGSTKEEKLSVIKEDEKNLIKAIRDLKNEGISYNSLSLDSFKAAIVSDEKADEIAWALVQSDIITSSLRKMMNKLLDGQSYLESVNYDFNGDGYLDNLDDVYWKPADMNNPSHSEPGELAYLLRTLQVIDSLNGASDLGTDVVDSSVLCDPLHKVNDSTVLRGLIPSFMDKALSSVNTWKHNPTPTLTKEQWDEEIDTLGNLIVTINDPNGDMNTADKISLNSLSLTGENKISTNNLKAILKAVVPSRILNIESIYNIICTSVNTVFEDTIAVYDPEHPENTTIGVVTWEVTSDDVETWNNRIAAWNTEIDALCAAVEKLQNVSSTDITDTTATGDDDQYQGVKNARSVGEFLDTAQSSAIIGSLTDAIVAKTVGTLGSGYDEMINGLGGTYSYKLRYLATYYCTAKVRLAYYVSIGDLDAINKAQSDAQAAADLVA